MVLINSNGSKWGGEQPDQLAALFERLASTPLDPEFEDYGNFCCGEARKGIASKDEQTGETVYLSGDPIYPEAPTAVRFWGNFYEVSAVFSIDTDEPDLIEKLTTAIRANQASPAYLAAKVQCEVAA